MSNNANNAKPTRVVILGAGFGGVYAFKRLHSIFHRDPSVKLILVNSRNYFLFTPLLHEVATGGVSRENIVEPLRKVLGCCLAEFYLAEAKRVDLREKRVITTCGDLDYDYLILALGAETNFYGTPGAEERSFGLKSLEDAVRLKNHFIKKFEESSTVRKLERLDAKLRFVVVGGGPTGVELAAEMAEMFYETFRAYYRDHFFHDKIKITLVQRQQELLSHFSKKVRAKSLEVLRKKGVDVKLGVRVERIGDGLVELSNGERIKTETVIWVAGVKPREISFDQNVEQGTQGKIKVNEFLQMHGWPEVFIVGDLAEFLGKDGKKLPALAQVATKEGENVAENIARMMQGKPLYPFLYSHAGDLISLGQWMAVAEIKKFSFWGHFAWWLWRTVYLSKLISFPKKIKVAVDWTINLFMPRDISEL